jgi:hypothetical protein
VWIREMVFVDSSVTASEGYCSIALDDNDA